MVIQDCLGKRKMTSRERVGMVFEGRIPDRVPMHDGYWEDTLIRWQREGLAPEVAEDRDDSLHEFFGNEIRLIRLDSSFRFKERILDEDERYITKITKNGTVVKFIKNHTSTPGLISFPVNSRPDWIEHKVRLDSPDGRLPADLDRLYKDFRENDRFVMVCVHDPYEASWSKLGPTYLLESMSRDPGLVKEVFHTITELNIRVCEELIGRGYEVDGAWIWGDIAYSTGTFFSPHMYQEILYPFHCRLMGYFKGLGLPIVYHSDGDIRRVIPLLLAAGATCIQPVESKANMDLLKLKREYRGRLVLMGGVDFERIARGPEEAEKEIRDKVGGAKEGGGYIYHSDHSIPPTMGLEDYRRVRDMVRHYGAYGPGR
jgi:uroporphyrinogen decarboxylase